MSMPDAQCKTCGASSRFVFTKTILSKYDVAFFQCRDCGFMQTERPYWLQETYGSSSDAFDTGLVARPLAFGDVTEQLIMRCFDPAGRFVDYGGAHGVFVRHMRDKGFDFYRYDKYAENIFARYFDVSDLPRKERNFELLTSFEVFEHFEDPIKELEELFSLSKNLLFSTFLQPRADASELREWWYLAELHGQHISFYTEKALRSLAERFGCYFHSNGCDLHLFTPRKLAGFTFPRPGPRKPPSLVRACSRLVHRLGRLRGRPAVPHPTTLIMKDAEWVKAQLLEGRSPGRVDESGGQG
ncbi:MAG TPA: class I SAM-dependent methyltransferase [Anaeromyxobacteraceae bacterium]|nr:class I SAM-dependent methyltransferase [Anaeromyxobacteraceae bacterium]